MKRIATMAAALALAAAGATVPTGQALAQATSTATAQNCNHYIAGEVVDAHSVRIGGDGLILGSVQLCKSGNSYWAYIVYYDTMPSGFWGQAYLHRHHNGTITPISCDNSGGNGYVQPGQTLCWTRKLDSLSSTDTFQAIGGDYASPHPDTSVEDAWGSTKLTR